MVKIILVIFVMFLNAQASVYETNCVKCHQGMPVKIDKFFYRYLLKYSSEIETKYAMTQYLKNPTKETSILNRALLNRFGVKKKTTLNDKELKEAIDEYWNIYKIFGKLK